MRERKSAEMKRRTEINIQMERLTIVRPRRSTSMNAWCEGCARQSTFLTVDEAAAVARSTSRDIYRRVEANRLHFTETPAGSLLICLNSLF
jgi:hypothetical protein